MTVNWTAADDANTYGVAGGYKGWCNLDKEDVYDKKMPIKQPHCDCKYDGQAGAICEVDTESFCINQCTDNGICQQGFCVVSPFDLPFDSKYDCGCILGILSDQSL